jgi:hypothetical protein
MSGLKAAPTLEGREHWGHFDQQAFDVLSDDFTKNKRQSLKWK